MDEMFSHDYDMDELKLITPAGRDFQMYVTPRFLYHYCENSYEAFSSDLILRRISGRSTFIDVGAHYGFYTLLVGSHCPSCKILSFEPSPVNYQVLLKNVKHNALENVKLYHAAASDRKGTASFQITAASDNCGFSGHPVSPGIEQIEVETVRLDDIEELVAAEDVVVKIDTEGHEYEVIRGMEGLIGRCANVVLLVEFNPKCIRNAGRQPEDLLEMIGGFGFDLYFILDDRRMYYRAGEDAAEKWQEYMRGYEDRYLNLLCIKKERSLNICFFSHSSQVMGAERSMTELVKELVEDHGAMVTVVIPDEGPLRQKLAETGCGTALRGYRWWCGNAEQDLDQAMLDSYLNIVPFIDSELRRINPDVVITNTIVIPWGALAAQMLDRPHIWFVREFGQLDYHLRFYRPFTEVLDIIRGSSSMILTCSRALKNELFGGDDVNILPVYTHFAVPPAAADSAKNFFKYGSALKLVITGSVAEHKGQMDTVLAVTELLKEGEDVELLIAGPAYGDYIERLKQAIEDAGIGDRVRLIGWLEDVYPLVRQADVVLVCSRCEAFGRVTAEAMMMEKPVIGTRAGGTVELVREGYNGLLYEPGDYRSLAICIKFFIDHREKIAEYGKNGYEFARRTFTRDKYGGTVYRIAHGLKGKGNPMASAFYGFVADLTAEAIRIRERQVAELSGALQAKEVQVAELSGALQAKEVQVAELSGALQAKEVQVAELSGALQSKEVQVAELSGALQSKEVQVAELSGALQAKEAFINQIMSGAVMRMMTGFKVAMDRIFPSGTRRSRYYTLMIRAVQILASEGIGALIKRIISYTRSQFFRMPHDGNEIIDYYEWLVRNDQLKTEIEKQIKRSQHLKYKPFIGIFIPAWNYTSEYISHCIESIIQQSYDRWELYLMTDRGRNERYDGIRNIFNKYAERIHVVDGDFRINREEMQTLVNSKIDYMCIMTPECILTPYAFYEIARLLNLNRKIKYRFIYSDSDYISPDSSKIYNPLYKPDWSPYTLRSFNYIGEAFIVSKAVFMAAIAEDLKLADKYDLYDLILRTTELSGHVGHIPAILYHKKSALINPMGGIAAGDQYRLNIIKSWRYTAKSYKEPACRFSLIILNKDKPEYIIPLINALLKGAVSYDCEIIIGDTGTRDKRVLEYYELLEKQPDIKIIPGLKYHFSANYNTLICEHAGGEIIGIMNNDIIVDDLSFLDAVENVIAENTDKFGAAGFKMLYPDGRLQHGGVFFMEKEGEINGLPYHRLHGGDPCRIPENKVQMVPAVTGAFMFFRKECFIDLQGFDEKYQEEAQDIDFCLKCIREGRQNYFINDGHIVHIENGTRPKWSENRDDRQYFLWKWRSFLEAAVLGNAINNPFGQYR